MTATTSLQSPLSPSKVEIRSSVVGGDVLNPQEGHSSVVTTGSIINFGTPQTGPKTDEERLEEVREFIQKAASRGTPAVTIEDILTPPSDEF